MWDTIWMFRAFRAFRLPKRCSSELHSSVILRSVTGFSCRTLLASSSRVRCPVVFCCLFGSVGIELCWDLCDPLPPPPPNLQTVFIFSVPTRLSVYVQRYILALLRNHCCHGNTTLRCIFIVIVGDEAVNNIKRFSTAMEIQKWVSFALLLSHEIFRTAVNNKYSWTGCNHVGLCDTSSIAPGILCYQLIPHC
jgi:hypothetical protein